LAASSDPILAICVKETTGVLLVAPWIAYRCWQRTPLAADRRCLVILAAAGLATQLCGNVPAFWALGVIGLTVTIPIVIGVNLVTSAVLGQWLLKERVSGRSAAAIALLIVAVILLSVGASGGQPSASHVAQPGNGAWFAALAVLGVCVAGAAYSLLNISIRYTTGHGTPIATVVLLIPGMGTLVLGPWALWKLGPAALAQVPLHDLGLMAGCGLLNLLAFAAFSRGLQLTSVVHANVANATQTAFAAVAGMALFGESASAALLGGISLTVIGMLLMDPPAVPNT
jgi:drug/metabolite transporter (DMT)-like permease